LVMDNGYRLIHTPEQGYSYVYRKFNEFESAMEFKEWCEDVYFGDWAIQRGCYVK
jgi:hypothetical protein